MLSKTGFTHSELLCWQIDYAGGSLNVNGTIMRDTYKDVVNASDGCTTEERLVTFTKIIIDDRIYPQRFISFIFPIFSSFAQGHFLDINYMNTLINDVEKTEPVGVIPTMANEVSN
ncbi:hypothetical protein OP553_000273 [Salmonella enterica]|nr:hypothetical protein [Salmonella enterica]